MRIIRPLFITLSLLAALATGVFFLALPQWASDSPRFNAELIYRSMAHSSHGAVKGPDGWLFYRNSLLSIVIPWPRSSADRIVAFRDALRSKGIELVFVPVPNKEYVYPEKIGSFIPKNPCRQRTDLLNHLQKRGVHVIDLLPLFLAQKAEGEPLYDAYDTHGTDRANLLMAKAIADTVRTIIPSIADTQQFSAKDTIEIHCADMIHLMDTHTDCSGTYPMKRTSVRMARGLPYENDPHSPVFIFGDSNVNEGGAETADVGAQVSRLLGRRVQVAWRMKAVNVAPGFYKTFETKLSKEVRVFICVFASRSLAEPIEQ
jgi:hypothetical protein